MLKPIKWYTSLADGKIRRHEGLFLVEGSRVISQIAANASDHIIEILCVDEQFSLFPDIPHRTITRSQCISIAQSQTPQGVFAVVRIPQDCYGDDLPKESGKRIVILEDVQDPGNVGTLLRTAGALGFDGMVLTDKCADPLSPKAAQATAGSMFSLWWRKSANAFELIDQLRSRGFSLCATVVDQGVDITSTQFPQKLMLALGNEAHGVSQELLAKTQMRCTIPQNTHGAESLNVAVAGGIAMFVCQKGMP